MGNATFKDSFLRGNQHSLTESLIVTKDMNVRDVYDIVDVIGMGSISTIYKIRRKRERAHEDDDEVHDTTSQEGNGRVKEDCEHPILTAGFSRKQADYALKEIHLTKVDPRRLRELQNEIDVLRRLDHPNIIRAYETYNYISDDNKSVIGVVLELCDGGDLYSRTPYTEQQAGEIIYKLAEAVNYMHQHNFIHRDIKIENIMFESSDPDANIKLIDFGLSTKFWKGENFEQLAGTVYTMAPQVIMGHYTQAADMWSVGVVAFILLSGEKPFWASTMSMTAQKVIRGEYTFTNDVWKSISNGAKGFVTKLLQYHPHLRLNSQQALQDEWLAQFKPTVDQSVARDILSGLHHLSPMSEFEKLAWLIVARMAEEDEIAQMRKVFEELDQNHDGQISFREFKTVMIKVLGYSPKEVDDLFHHVDVQCAGVVDYSTFLAALLAAQGVLQNERLWQVFDHLDLDGCGYITHNHLRQILGSEVSDEYIDKLIKVVDTNNDGKICYQDFKLALQKKAESKMQTVKPAFVHGGETLGSIS